MTGQLWEIPMSLVNGLRQYKVGHIVACTWLLSSCGGSGEGTGPAYAYVANEGTLSTYSINPSTGGLTASAGSPLSFPTGWPFAGISQIATDPSGQFLYLLDYSGVYAYAINRNTGALTAVAGSPFDAGSTPTSLAFSLTVIPFPLASSLNLEMAGRTFDRLSQEPAESFLCLM